MVSNSFQSHILLNLATPPLPHNSFRSLLTYLPPNQRLSFFPLLLLLITYWIQLVLTMCDQMWAYPPKHEQPTRSQTSKRKLILPSHQSSISNSSSARGGPLRVLLHQGQIFDCLIWDFFCRLSPLMGVDMSISHVVSVRQHFTTLHPSLQLLESFYIFF